MDTAVTDPLVGRLVDGRYAVESRIARGGMATVYLATDTRLDREVALKVMHPHLADDAEFVARFHREAKSAARLSNPHVVAVYDQGADRSTGVETVYLAMEHVQGRTLRDLLDERGPLTPREALDVLDPVLDALAAAHRAGLVHRDVKPENVLIAEDGRVTVADFGLARAASSSSSGTTTGMLIGTVAYLSPELVSRGVADARSDVYAAGILLFELLTGTQPFSGEVPIQVAFQHVNDDVPLPSERLAGLSDVLDDLVAWATARDPDDRPADARDLLAELRAVRAGLPASDLDAEPPHAQAGGGTASPARGRTLALRRRGALALPPDTDETSEDGGDVAAQRPVARGRSGRGRSGRGRTWRGRTGSTVPTGWDQRRRSRRGLVALLLVLTLALAGGVAGWWLTAGPGAYTATPDLAGRTADDAEQVLATRGLAMRADERFDDSVAEGRVISSDPGAGQDVRDGGTVQVAVSRGPEMRAVPDVAGSSREDAVATLEDVGLVAGDVSEVFSQDVADGSVVEQATAPGQELRAGEPVDLVVSKGREPVDAPDLVGLARGEAETAAQDAGLRLEASEEFSDDVPEGDVVSQQPDGGQSLFRGDTVTVTVSLGPPLVEVPTLRGQQVGPARDALEQAGFAVEVERVLGGIFGTVRDQSPAGGSQQPRGSTVTLTVV